MVYINHSELTLPPVTFCVAENTCFHTPPLPPGGVFVVVVAYLHGEALMTMMCRPSSVVIFFVVLICYVLCSCFFFFVCCCGVFFEQKTFGEDLSQAWLCIQTYQARTQVRAVPITPRCIAFTVSSRSRRLMLFELSNR